MDENQLKNHQLLETCGVEIFRKIQRKQIVLGAKEKSDQVVKEEKSKNNEEQ